MLGPPGFPNFPSVRGKSFSSEFSMLFANKESNIYVAEPHEAGASVLNRHRYDVYVVYIYIMFWMGLWGVKLTGYWWMGRVMLCWTSLASIELIDMGLDGNAWKTLACNVWVRKGFDQIPYSWSLAEHIEKWFIISSPVKIRDPFLSISFISRSICGIPKLGSH